MSFKVTHNSQIYATLHIRLRKYNYMQVYLRNDFFLLYFLLFVLKKPK